MDFKNVVFSAARDGKLRRLKVSNTVQVTIMSPSDPKVTDQTHTLSQGHPQVTLGVTLK